MLYAFVSFRKISDGCSEIAGFIKKVHVLHFDNFYSLGLGLGFLVILKGIYPIYIVALLLAFWLFDDSMVCVCVRKIGHCVYDLLNLSIFIVQRKVEKCSVENQLQISYSFHFQSNNLLAAISYTFIYRWF